jgi:hypothetical protein
MVKRKIGVEDIPHIEKYYNDLNKGEDGVKEVLEYQMFVINKYWKSIVTIIMDSEGFGPLRIEVEPLFNIKGDEEE